MRTICIYHSRDLDGWMSAAIVKYWFINNYKDSYYVTNEGKGLTDKSSIGYGKHHLHFLGWDYGDKIPDLSEYDEVIMCDISFQEEKMFELYTDFGEKLIYIDHHVSAINSIKERIGLLPNGLFSTNFAACELTWKYFFPNEEMPEIVRLLGMYDSFRHKQQWKPVVGYEGLYEVSNQGNVRSLDRTITEKNTGKKRLVKGKNLSITNSKRGYRVVVLCKEGTEKMRNVHQLVAEAFISNPENKPCINHKDLNRLNNHLDNLEWCTYKENNLHSIKFGGRGKSVMQLSKDGIEIEEFSSIKEAEEKTKVAHQNITKVCKGERDFAGGYRWEYTHKMKIVKQFIPIDEEQKVLEFQYGARQVITNYEEAYEYLLYCISDYKHGESDTLNDILNRGKSIYQYLCTEAKQDYSKAFPIEFNNLNYTEQTIFSPFKFLCINKQRFNPINFDIDYHKDGYDGFACFWYKDDKWMWSLYNDNGEIDVSLIAKQYGGGGHFSAAGMVVSTDIMLKIIKNK